MAVKNVKDILTQAAALPAAIEGKLPAGAPKVSTMVLDAAGKIPDTLPDFPIDLPDLPGVPKLPDFKGGPGSLMRQIVNNVEVKPLPSPSSAGKRGMLTIDKPGSVATRGML